MSSQNYRWHRRRWKPMRRICRSTVFRGSLTAGTGCRVFAVLCELRPEPADEIAEVLLNNTYAVFNVRG
ncbi:hypothetical protein ACULNC_21550 [Shigella flexneri]